MYRVKTIDGTQWQIIDCQDHTVFAGNKQQAEDWLDFQENMSRQAHTGLVQKSPARVVTAVLSIASGISHGVPTFFQKFGALTHFIGRLSSVPGNVAQSQDFQEPEIRSDAGVIVQRMEARRSGMVRGPAPVRHKNVHQKG